MKTRVIVSCILSAVLSVLIAGSAGAAGPVDACTLFTKADAEALFNDKAASQKTDKTVAPAGNICSYFFKYKGGTYSVKVKVSSSQEIKAEGIFSSAREVYDRQKKARMASPETAKKMKAVPGLGDEAFWNGYDLWMVKGDYLVLIMAHGPLPGSFKNQEAMAAARADQDLGHSQKAAAKILLKIK